MKKLRNDIILIASILIIALIGIILLLSLSKRDNLAAEIYYDDELIMTINLDKEAEYIITGDVSDLIIKTDINEIWVSESGCPDLVCVHQGHVKSTASVITCLPNKIYIKVIGGEEVDLIVWVLKD